MTKYFGLFLLLFMPLLSSAQFKVPTLQGPVMDLAQMMNSRDREVIELWIREFHDRGQGQLQVLTVPNLAGTPIEQASIQITDQWKIGDAKRDDGVLLLVALEERKIRIEVGQGLEGAIPDIEAKQIIADIMVPFFRQGLASQGIVQGARQILREMDAEFKPSVEAGPAPMKKSRKSPLKQYEGLFFLVFIIFMLIVNLFRPRGRRSFWGGGGSGWGGGGFGGFGGGGGGGWSGGGGGFSGGGASGNW